MYRVGIDLGGTNIAAGLVNEEYKIVYKKSIPTKAERGATEIFDDMANLVQDLCKEAGVDFNEVVKVGIGCPGTANKATGILEYANNLNFNNISITKYLSDKLNKEVVFDNDANAAALGEYLVCGEANPFVMVTLGTGVGGGVIIDGKLLRGVNYAGAELGHTTLVQNGEECTCGRKGCFEQYCSTRALVIHTKEAMDENKNSLLWEKCNHDKENLNGLIICECVQANDETAVKVFGEYVDYLVAGITNIVNIFQPEKLCIGGGISASAHLFLDELKSRVRKESYSRNSEVQTEILMAELGNDAGIIGAAFLD